MINGKADRLRKKIIESRTRLMQEQPFFGILLMYFTYVADTSIKGISTNGRCIAFSPTFLDKLYPTELDYVLCHTALHIAMEHIWRHVDKQGETYHHACDIAVNSILYECGYKQKSFPHLGKIYRDECFAADDHRYTADAIYDSLCYRMEMFDERTRARILFDSDAWWDIKYYSGRRHEIILQAEDEPLNYQYGHENHYAGAAKDNKPSVGDEAREDGYDNDGDKDDGSLKREWESRVQFAEKIVMQLNRGEGFGIGDLPSYKERKRGRNTRSETDWKEILNAFIQEQICDYSFLPPDKRFGEMDIFLPDFNEKENIVKDVLFMIDTSGSFDNDMIAASFAEIEAALEQFDGRLTGKAGFFDAHVHSVRDFASIADIDKMIPIGGGGTDYSVIFDYVHDELANEISSLVILTDGYAEFHDACGITYPVLWLINNDVIIPPFGRTVRVLPVMSRV